MSDAILWAFSRKPQGSEGLKLYLEKALPADHYHGNS